MRPLRPFYLFTAFLFGLFLMSVHAEDMSWVELPQVVRDAVLNEAPGIQIEEIEREMKNGDLIYKIEGEMNGNEVELKISANGVVLEAEYEESEQEEGEDDDHDHDGMRDSDEDDHGCDPNDSDSDDDSFPDGFEHDHGSDPLDPASQPQIMAIRTECTEGGGICLLVHVQTFALGRFQLETTNANNEWVLLGQPFDGDGSEVIFEMPLPGGAGMFRTTIVSTPSGGSSGDGGTGTGGSGSSSSTTCGVPNSMAGMHFLVVDHDGETKTYVMSDTGLSGEMVEEEEDGEVEFYPFDYTYTVTGECSARISITFPSDDEEEKGVVIDISFTAQGIGDVTMRRFEGNHFEDPDSGNFIVSNLIAAGS